MRAGVIRAIGGWAWRAAVAAVALGVWAAGAGPKDVWIEVKSPNFTVISDAGEKEARQIANQFEQFRELLHSAFPKMRVDLGKPLIIFAVKNESGVKNLLPAYWEKRGNVHPDGVYLPTDDRHYVVLRTDVETQHPYGVIYHEYTHAIMNLNFHGLPLWLNEGLAEYYGNSVIHDDYAEIGKPAEYHLIELQQESLIPVNELFEANETSKYYNEANHAGMFYAESWAIVHYLMLSPEARQNNLLKAFFEEWDKNGDQLEAAEKAFGDLKKFQAVMSSYARQKAFYVAKVTIAIRGNPNSFTSRILPDAELDAERALFYAHTGRAKETFAAVDAVLKADPNLAMAYEAKGFVQLLEEQNADAEASFEKAIALQTTDYFPYYYAAEALMKDGRASEKDAPKAIEYLEKSVQINPMFAPAYAALASLYAMNPETQQKAFSAGRKAVELEPGNLKYAINVGYVLANEGKTVDAKELALRIQQAARTPEDRAGAQQLLSVIASHEEYDRREAEAKKEAGEPASGTSGATATVNATPSGTTTVSTTTKAATAADRPPDAGSGKAPVKASSAHPGEDEYAVEGNIVSADCVGGPGKVVLELNGGKSMSFWYPDFAGVEVVSTVKGDVGRAPSCVNWKGRHVRLYFFAVRGKEFAGDVETLWFY